MTPEYIFESCSEYSLEVLSTREQFVMTDVKQASRGFCNIYAVISSYTEIARTPFINCISIKITGVWAQWWGQSSSRALTSAPPLDVRVRAASVHGLPRASTGSAVPAPGRESGKGSNKGPESSRELRCSGNPGTPSESPPPSLCGLVCVGHRAHWRSRRDCPSSCTGPVRDHGHPPDLVPVH